MSRTRLEREPDHPCGFAWDAPGDTSSSIEFPHICRLPVSDHGDDHICCGTSGGTISIHEENADG